MKKQAATHKAAGNNAFAAARYYAATAEFTKAIECDPYDHIFYSNRSACYANLDQYSKACADARRCIELRPDFAKGYSRLGFALFKAGFLHDAMSAYERGLTVDPKNNNLIEGLGEAKLAQKQKIEAAKLAAEMDNVSLDEHVIGIDLGTTYSCVSVWRNGEAHVLTNAEGDRTTPSWVAFTEQGRLVGDAKRQAAINPKNTLFNVKRIIGRQYSECGEELELMPFDVREGDGGKPVISVDVNGEKKDFAPEQVSAMVLQKMKATARRSSACRSPRLSSPSRPTSTTPSVVKPRMPVPLRVSTSCVSSTSRPPPRCAYVSIAAKAPTAKSSRTTYLGLRSRWWYLRCLSLELARRCVRSALYRR